MGQLGEPDAVSSDEDEATEFGWVVTAHDSMPVLEEVVPSMSQDVSLKKPCVEEWRTKQALELWETHRSKGIVSYRYRSLLVSN